MSERELLRIGRFGFGFVATRLRLQRAIDAGQCPILIEQLATVAAPHQHKERSA
jgi:hypothetical protein